MLFFVYFSLILSCSLSSWNFFLTALKATWLFDTFLCRLTETQASVTTHPHQLSSKRYCSNVTSELVTVLLHCIGAGRVSHQLLFISVFCFSIQYQHSVCTFQLSLLSTLSPCFIHVYRRGCGRDVVNEDVLSERDGPRDRLILLPVSSWIFFKIFSKTGMCKIWVANCEFYKCQNIVWNITVVMTVCSLFIFKAQVVIYINAFFNNLFFLHTTVWQ